MIYDNLPYGRHSGELHEPPPPCPSKMQVLKGSGNRLRSIHLNVPTGIAIPNSPKPFFGIVSSITDFHPPGILTEKPLRQLGAN